METRGATIVPWSLIGLSFGVGRQRHSVDMLLVLEVRETVRLHFHKMDACTAPSQEQPVS